MGHGPWAHDPWALGQWLVYLGPGPMGPLFGGVWPYYSLLFPGVAGLLFPEVTQYATRWVPSGAKMRQNWVPKVPAIVQVLPVGRLPLRYVTLGIPPLSKPPR